MSRDATSGVFTRTSNTFSNPTAGQVMSPTDAILLFADYDSGISGSVGTPASSTDNAVMRWDGTTGKFSQNSVVTISDLGQFSGHKVPKLGYISGLTLSTAGSSATFGIATGTATDSTNVAQMDLGSAYTKTTSSWAVGSTNGALDTGAIAPSTWYHVNLIMRSDTGVVDVLISLSSSAPTMPSNYDRKRRIGAMKTNGSSQWTKFVQLGNEFLWDVPVRDISSAGPINTTSASSFTLSVPTGVQVNALFNFAFAYGSATAYGLLTSLDQADTTPSATVNSGFVASTYIAYPGDKSLRTNTSAQIRIRVSHASAAIDLYTNGWVDFI